jgi:hypothetical protein
VENASRDIWSCEILKYLCVCTPKIGEAIVQMRDEVSRGGREKRHQLLMSQVELDVTI